MKPMRVAAVLASCLAVGTAGAAPDTRFDLQFVEQPWAEVGLRLEQVGGQPIVIDVRLADAPAVTVSFEQLTLAAAVQRIADEAMVAFAELPTGGYLFYRADQPRWVPPTVRASIRVEHVLPSKLAVWLGGRALVTGDLKLRDAGPGGRTVAATALSEPARIPPPGITDLVGFDLISALIVRGTPEGVEQLRQRVARMDVEPQPIAIEAIWLALTPEGVDRLAAVVGHGQALKLTETDTVNGGATWDALQPLLADGASVERRTFKGRVMSGTEASLAWAPEDPSRPADTMTIEPRQFSDGSVSLRLSRNLVEAVDGQRTHTRRGVASMSVKPGYAAVMASATSAGQPWVLMVRAEAIAD